MTSEQTKLGYNDNVIDLDKCQVTNTRYCKGKSERIKTECSYIKLLVLR